MVVDLYCKVETEATIFRDELTLSSDTSPKESEGPSRVLKKN